MGKSEISLHEIKIAKVIRTANKWISNKEIAAMVGAISERTVRAHTLRLVHLGLLDQAEVFPAHRYRWAEKADKRNSAYLLRLTQAAEVFGLKIGE